MTEVTYTGTARKWSTIAHDGLTVEPDESVDVSEEFATHLVENHDFERADASSGDNSGGSSAEDSGADDSADADTSASDDTDDSDAGEWMVELEGVGPSTADKLEDAGYASLDDVRSADADELAAVDGVSESLAESIKEQVGD